MLNSKNAKLNLLLQHYEVKRIQLEYQLNINYIDNPAQLFHKIIEISKQYEIFLFLSIADELSNGKGVKEFELEYDYITPNSALRSAIISNNVQIFKYFIEELKFDISQCETLLHLSVLIGNFEIVKYILNLNINNNYRNFVHLRAFDITLIKGDKKMMKLFLRNGISFKSYRNYQLYSFLYVVSSGNFKFIKYICENFEFERKSADIDLMNALLIALSLTDNPISSNLFLGVNEIPKNYKMNQFLSEEERLEIVKYLVEREKFDLNYKDKFQNDIFYYAAKGGSKKVMEYLYLKAPDRFYKSINQNNRLNILHIASFNNNINLLKQIIEWRNNHINNNNIDIKDIKDKDGKNLIHYSAMGGDVECLKYLISLNIDYNEISYCDETPFMIAIHLGKLNFIKYLVEEMKLNIDDDIYKKKEISYDDENSIVFRAIESGDFQCIKYIFSIGFSALTNSAKKNWNLIHFYISSCQCIKFDKRIIKLLIRKGVDINALDDLQQTPIHLAVSFHLEFDVISSLLKNGSSVYSYDVNGISPLNLAIRENVSRSVIHLLFIKSIEIYTSISIHNCSQKKVQYLSQDGFIIERNLSNIIEGSGE